MSPSPLSDYGENRVLDVFFGAGTKPDPIYVALCFTEPTETGDGTTLNEPTTGGYARVAVPNTATYWQPANAGVKRNLESVSFPTATADWGTTALQYFAFTTALTGGFLIGWGVLANGRRIYSGMTPRFDAGDLSITSAD